MSDYATLVQVVVEARGSALTVTANVTDTTLTIDYAGDFDADGGILDLNGARLEYTGVTEGTNPDDDDVLQLAAPLAVAGDVDDFVGSVENNTIGEDWYAVCNQEEIGDRVMVPLNAEQRLVYPIGQYDPPWPVVISEDLQTLFGAPGQTVSTRNAFSNTDTYTYDGTAASIRIPLTKVPISGSEQPFWSAYEGAGFGQALPPGTWYIDLPHLVIDDGYYMGQFAADDLFWVTYAWDQALDDIQIPRDPPELLPTEGFEAGTDGAETDAASTPGLDISSGTGYFIAEPHTGEMAATFNDAFVGAGAGDLRTLFDASEVSAVGVFMKFLPTTLSPGDTQSHRLRLGRRVTGGFPGDTVYVTVYLEMDLADPDFPSDPFIRITDSNAVDHAKFAISFDSWYEARYETTGAWSVLDASSTVLDSGELGDTPPGRELYVVASSLVAPARMVVDDFYSLTN